MDNIRIAAFLAKREKLGELLDAVDVAKEKLEALLDKGDIQGVALAQAAYKRAAEAVFQQQEIVAKERIELVKLGLLKPRKKN